MQRLQCLCLSVKIWRKPSLIRPAGQPTCNWTCPGGFPADQTRRDHWCWSPAPSLYVRKTPLVPSLHIWPSHHITVNVMTSDKIQLTPGLSGDRADWWGWGRVLRTWLRSWSTIRTESEGWEIRLLCLSFCGWLCLTLTLSVKIIAASFSASHSRILITDETQIVMIKVLWGPQYDLSRTL